MNDTNNKSNGFTMRPCRLRGLDKSPFWIPRSHQNNFSLKSWPKIFFSRKRNQKKKNLGKKQKKNSPKIFFTKKKSTFGKISKFSTFFRFWDFFKILKIFNFFQILRFWDFFSDFQIFGQKKNSENFSKKLFNFSDFSIFWRFFNLSVFYHF